MKVLRLKLYQPQAHYRLPFTYKRRHTYPIPPYSTVIGMLCNVLGIRNLRGEGEPEDGNFRELKRIKLSVAGRFVAKTTEYIWFRNLSKKSHRDRFGSATNRRINGLIEHPGGQSPVSIDILNDVHLLIYVHHDDAGFLKTIEDALHSPERWLSPLHLGRAEDWVVIEDVSIVSLSDTEKPVRGYPDWFFYVPEDKAPGVGLAYRLPTFYRLIDGVRTFDFVRAYLVSSGFAGEVKTRFDEEADMPVFLTTLTEAGQDEA